MDGIESESLRGGYQQTVLADIQEHAQIVRTKCDVDQHGRGDAGVKAPLERGVQGDEVVGRRGHLGLPQLRFASAADRERYGSSVAGWEAGSEAYLVTRPRGSLSLGEHGPQFAHCDIFQNLTRTNPSLGRKFRSSKSTARTLSMEKHGAKVQ